MLPVANYTAQAQEYANADVYRERSYVWRRFPLGFGDSSQQGNGDPPRYAYARNTWFAGAYRGLGPRYVPFAATLTADEGEVAGFVEARHSRRLYAPVRAGRALRAPLGRLYRRAAGLSLDLGAGVAVRSWARWAAGGPGQQDALYLTTTTSQLWRYQGGAWTNLTAGRPAGRADPGHRPRAVALHRRRPRRRPRRRTGKCEADPPVPANWTAPIAVGDASVNVTGLGELQLRLFAFKADG